jgi:cytochrome c5
MKIKNYQFRLAGLLAGAGLMALCLTHPVAAAPTDTNAPAVNLNPADVKPAPVTVSPGITGAELYSMHCNRCHPERYPTERTAAQWKTIMLHMQVRANIPGSQARQILKYLQENSGR